jgi:hypothetical protein
MRQLFTSPRLENVEAVAKLLGEAGIEHKITGGRSYRGHSRRQFSYSDKNPDRGEQPAVWVLKSEDYKRSRELMNELGLLENEPPPSYLPDSVRSTGPAAGDSQARLLKVRIALLVVLVAVAGGIALRLLLGH